MAEDNGITPPIEGEGAPQAKSFRDIQAAHEKQVADELADEEAKRRAEENRVNGLKTRQELLDLAKEEDSKISTTDDERKNIDQRVSEILGQISDITRSVDSKRTEMESKQSEWEELSALLKDCRERQADIAPDLLDLEKSLPLEIGQIRSAIDNLESQATNLQDEAEQLRDKVSEDRTTLDRIDKINQDIAKIEEPVSVTAETVDGGTKTRVENSAVVETLRDEADEENSIRNEAMRMLEPRNADPATKQFSREIIESFLTQIFKDGGAYEPGNEHNRREIMRTAISQLADGFNRKYGPDGLRAECHNIINQRYGSDEVRTNTATRLLQNYSKGEALACLLGGSLSTAVDKLMIASYGDPRDPYGFYNYMPGHQYYDARIEYAQNVKAKLHQGVKEYIPIINKVLAKHSVDNEMAMGKGYGLAHQYDTAFQRDLNNIGFWTTPECPVIEGSQQDYDREEWSRLADTFSEQKQKIQESMKEAVAKEHEKVSTQLNEKRREMTAAEDKLTEVAKLITSHKQDIDEIDRTISRLEGEVKLDEAEESNSQTAINELVAAPNGWLDRSGARKQGKIDALQEAKDEISRHKKGLEQQIQELRERQISLTQEFIRLEREQEDLGNTRRWQSEAIGKLEEEAQKLAKELNLD